MATAREPGYVCVYASETCMLIQGGGAGTKHLWSHETFIRNVGGPVHETFVHETFVGPGNRSYESYSALLICLNLFVYLLKNPSVDKYIIH